MAVPRWRRGFAMAEIVESREGKRGFSFQQSFPCWSETTRDCVDALCEATEWAVLTVLALTRTSDAEIGAPAFGGLGHPKLRAPGVHLENHSRILQPPGTQL